jgi:hypothetical protein
MSRWTSSGSGIVVMPLDQARAVEGEAGHPLPFILPRDGGFA